MINQGNFRTISDMREKATKLLKDTESGPLYITYRSKPKVVLLSIEEYNRLQEMAEDYDLFLEAQEYEKQDKSKMKWLTHDELLAELAKS